jgi:hypothetical protein
VAPPDGWLLGERRDESQAKRDIHHAGARLSQPVNSFRRLSDDQRRITMAAPDSLKLVHARIGERIADIESRMTRLAPHTISQKMDAIRAMAAEYGLTALEGLADYGRHHAMMPGYAQATRSCLEHMGEALDSSDPAHDRETILAALAVRLH